MLSQEEKDILIQAVLKRQIIKRIDIYFPSIKLCYTLRNVKPNLGPDEPRKPFFIDYSFDIEPTIDSNGKKIGVIFVNRITGYEL